MPSPADRLRVLYEMNRRLATCTDLAELLRYATERARELFDAEGCALLLLDAERKEFHFPVASQQASRRGSADRLAEVRFPAERGIAGWVVSHDQSVHVPDVTRDPRFFAGVDRETAITTRSVLCVPLRTAWGTIGVIEVVNPGVAVEDQADVEFLEALAEDVAVAHEKVALHERLQAEVLGLRQACRMAGAALLGLGILCLVVAIVVHLAWALPLAELPGRPGVLLGLLGIGLGGVLFAVGHGRVIGRAGAPRRVAAAG
jgi:GAF domain-containing protein